MVKIILHEIPKGTFEMQTTITRPYIADDILIQRWNVDSS